MRSRIEGIGRVTKYCLCNSPLSVWIGTAALDSLARENGLRTGGEHAP
jgi:hypothetical protein